MKGTPSFIRQRQCTALRIGNPLTPPPATLRSPSPNSLPPPQTPHPCQFSLRQPSPRLGQLLRRSALRPSSSSTVQMDVPSRTGCGRCAVLCEGDVSTRSPKRVYHRDATLTGCAKNSRSCNGQQCVVGPGRLQSDHKEVREGQRSGDYRDRWHTSTHWTYALSTPSKLSKTHLIGTSALICDSPASEGPRHSLYRLPNIVREM